MTTAGSLVAGAVEQNAAWSVEGALERLFTHWFDSFVYNQIWEDPRADLEALALRSDSHLLTISSGGCNVLNYLTQRPARITAVDLNHHHISLLRLKLGALRHLPAAGDFFRFFASGDDRLNCTLFAEYVAPALDAATRDYWAGGGWLRQLTWGPRINYFQRGLYDQAKLGQFLRLLHLVARLSGRNLERMLEARTHAEQAAIFDEEVAPLFDTWLVRFVGRLPVALYSLGIPPQQFRALERERPDGIVATLRERVRRLACDFPIQDNYFAWQAFGRRYDLVNGRALPDYLRPEFFAPLKTDVGRVTTELSTVTGWLARQPAGAIDRVVLLDSQDWMTPTAIDALWREIARVGRPGTRVIFRTAGSASPVETALAPAVAARFSYHREQSLAIHALDRSAIYGAFHLYTLNA